MNRTLSLVAGPSVALEKNHVARHRVLYRRSGPKDGSVCLVEAEIKTPKALSVNVLISQPFGGWADKRAEEAKGNPIRVELSAHIAGHRRELGFDVALIDEGSKASSPSCNLAADQRGRFVVFDPGDKRLDPYIQAVQIEGRSSLPGGLGNASIHPKLLRRQSATKQRNVQVVIQDMLEFIGGLDEQGPAGGFGCGGDHGPNLGDGDRIASQLHFHVSECVEPRRRREPAARAPPR